jgi:hypothetical protein
VPCCRYTIWCADKARQAVSNDAIYHIRGGHCTPTACWCLCTWPMWPLFSSHVSSALNIISKDCVLHHPLQAVAAFDGMVVICNGCDKEFASTSGRSKHSRRMNCGEYQTRTSRKNMSEEEKKLHESRRRHLALRQALAVRFTYTIMTAWLATRMPPMT